MGKPCRSIIQLQPEINPQARRRSHFAFLCGVCGLVSNEGLEALIQAPQVIELFHVEQGAFCACAPVPSVSIKNTTEPATKNDLFIKLLHRIEGAQTAPLKFSSKITNYSVR
jgi:hypothetical protein